MVAVTVLRRFRDLKKHVWRDAGDVFEATEGRAEEIADRLPGYVTFERVTEPEPVAEPEPEPEPEQVDLRRLTNAQLKALCEERGIKVPPHTKKEGLIALLTEE